MVCRVWCLCSSTHRSLSKPGPGPGSSGLRAPRVLAHEPGVVHRVCILLLHHRLPHHCQGPCRNQGTTNGGGRSGGGMKSSGEAEGEGMWLPVQRARWLNFAAPMVPLTKRRLSPSLLYVTTKHHPTRRKNSNGYSSSSSGRNAGADDVAPRIHMSGVSETSNYAAPLPAGRRNACVVF